MMTLERPEIRELLPVAPEPELDAVGKLLMRAADELESRGLCKGTLGDGITGEVCAIGAINVAHHGYPYYAWEGSPIPKFKPGGPDADVFGSKAVREAFGRASAVVGEPIHTFNNRPETTQAQVADVLRRAATSTEVAFYNY